MASESSGRPKTLGPSTLELIDAGFFEHIDEKFNIHTTTNKGFVKVPVIWQSAERTFQIKNDSSIRDKSGKLILPMMSVHRASVEKDKTFKGAVQAAFAGEPEPNREYKGGQFKIGTRVVQSKTSNFASADIKKINGQDFFPKGNKKIVVEEISIPMPTYVSITYQIDLKAEYQQQMNDMLTPFITTTGNINYFTFTKNNYSYEAFIQDDFGQESNTSSLGEDARLFTSKITIKVLGYLIGDQTNSPQPAVVYKENVVEFKMSRERTILDDDIPWKKKDNKYRR